MTGNYDGEIRILVNVVEEEFQKQMDNLGKTMKKSMSSISKVLGIIGKAAAVLAVGFLLIAAAVATIARGLIGAWKQVEAFTNKLYQSLSATSAMRGTVVALQSGFEAIKGSIMAIGATLLNAVAPILMRIIGWLVQAINFVSMIIASLTGQAKVMQYVSGAADEAEKGTGGMADNLERAKKAAEGALASFDELNVLQQDEGPGPGGPGIGGEVVMVEIDVPEGFAQNVWLKFVEFWDDVVKPAFAQSWTDFWSGIWDWLFGLFTTYLQILAIPFLWIALQFVKLWAWIKEVWAKAGPWFKSLWEGIKVEFGRIWTSVKQLAALALLWLLENVIWPIRDKFAEISETIKEKWETTFEGIRDFIKGIVNTIIGFLNGMIAGLVAGINVAIRALNKLSVTFPSWFPGGLGGKSFGINIAEITAPKIPELAGGAVIPPNQPFAAILGDQSSGKNIEAPESLLREIIQEELGQIQGDFTFNFAGSMGELVRTLNPYIEKENVRMGESLVQGSKP